MKIKNSANENRFCSHFRKTSLEYEKPFIKQSNKYYLLNSSSFSENDYKHFFGFFILKFKF